MVGGIHSTTMADMENSVYVYVHLHSIINSHAILTTLLRNFFLLFISLIISTYLQSLHIFQIKNLLQKGGGFVSFGAL